MNREKILKALDSESKISFSYNGVIIVIEEEEDYYSVSIYEYRDDIIINKDTGLIDNFNEEDADSVYLDGGHFDSLNTKQLLDWAINLANTCSRN